jgi:hypothetical protein
VGRKFPPPPPEQPFDIIVDCHAPGEAPQPLTLNSLGVEPRLLPSGWGSSFSGPTVPSAHSLHPTALMHPGAITTCLTRIKCVDLQKCYAVKSGEALPSCCSPRGSPAARDKGLEELRSLTEEICVVWNGGQIGPGEPVRFECGSPSFAACPMKPGNRPPKIKRRQLIPGRRWAILS